MENEIRSSICNFFFKFLLFANTIKPPGPGGGVSVCGASRQSHPEDRHQGCQKELPGVRWCYPHRAGCVLLCHNSSKWLWVAGTDSGLAEIRGRGLLSLQLRSHSWELGCNDEKAICLIISKEGTKPLLLLKCATHRCATHPHVRGARLTSSTSLFPSVDITALVIFARRTGRDACIRQRVGAQGERGSCSSP